jgi:hypothetical protein
MFLHGVPVCVACYHADREGQRREKEQREQEDPTPE